MSKQITTLLGDILNFENGKLPPKEKGKIPLYGGNGIMGYVNDYNYENVLIIGRVGANCGSIHIEENKCWISDNAIAGVHKNNKSNKYNFYLLKCLNLNKKHIGSSQPLLTQNILNKIKINIYSEPHYQQKIASVLSSLDAKIELNNRINSELESMAKTLYDYWFVQFDFPDKNGKPYKSSGGKMVWNAELKREIPEGWETKKLGKLLNISLGGTPSTENKSFWENGTIAWLNSGEVAEFPAIKSELKITPLSIESSSTELLSKGTVLLSITRHIRATILGIDACANQSVVGIKENGNIKHFYLYPFIRNEIPRFLSLRTGAQQPHINKETVENTWITLPSENSSILVSYNKIAAPIYMQIFNTAFQNQQIESIRDFLLPMLMNGQVKVQCH